MFSEEKVAQMAAYLLSKGGGRMAYLKLMKLLYLADRESMDRFGFPMSGDRMVSMPHGPVLSRTLNLMNGCESGTATGWEKWISGAENYELALHLTNASRDDYDELSPADLTLLDAVYSRFGHMSQWQIRDYTHEHCAEWSDPNGGSFTINPERVFRALGKSEESVRALADRMREINELEKLTSELR
ncbi:TPA: Panacea domain-containing protein [Enterobacter ludwigii]|uniref:Panacea domain-containing protein n=2 Tax=Enterobacter ludwigii TaxID=299767 RepID=UPI003B5FBDA4